MDGGPEGRKAPPYRTGIHRALFGRDGEDVHLSASDRRWERHALDRLAIVWQFVAGVEDVGLEVLATAHCAWIAAVGGSIRDLVAEGGLNLASIERPVAEAQREGLCRSIGIGDCCRAGSCSVGR